MPPSGSVRARAAAVAAAPTKFDRKTLDDVPTYVAAREKLEQFIHRQSKISLQQVELQEEWESLVDSNAQFRSLSGFSVRNFERHKKALALLAGDAGDQVVSRFTEIKQKLIELEEEDAVLGQAIQMQRPIVDREKIVASREIAPALFVEHQAICQRLHAAANELEDALSAHTEFARWMEAEEIMGVSPLNLAGVARASGEGFMAPFGAWYATMKSAGYDLFNRKANRPR
jgi:hypothetical protein